MSIWRTLGNRLFPLGTQGPDGPLAKIAGEYARFVPLVVLLGFTASLLESVGIGLLIPLLALMLSDALPPGLPAPLVAVFDATRSYSFEARVTAIAAAGLLLVVLKGLVQAANSTLILWIDGRIGRDIRTALASTILRVDYPFFLRTEPARLVEVISMASWLVSDAIRALLSFIPALIGLALFSVLLIWLDWRLYLVVVAGALVILAALLLIERRVRALSSRMGESNDLLTERMMAIIDAMRVVRIFGQQAREEERFGAAAERVRQTMFAAQRGSALIAPMLDVLVFALFLVILVAGYRMGTSIPTLTAFLVLLARSQPHAKVLSQGRLQIASVRGPVTDVEWLLAQPTPPVGQAKAEPVSGRHAIRFSNVHYTYPDGHAAVRGLDFEIREGVATALVGRSGSGKSTVVNLLCGLIEPQEGAITIGGRPLTGPFREAWRARIAIAGQDIELVEGTVAENIAYARPDASLEEIRQVAREAGAAEFIEALPAGYDTRVGQGGLRLSGGQRQRVGLARALLREPELLILDEATSAVDAMSEQELMTLLRQHRHFRTALIISHRRSALAACQDGIVIDGGRVREAGPLQDLAYFDVMAGDEP